VVYNGSSYLAIAASSNKTPADSIAYWDVLSANGESPLSLSNDTLTFPVQEVFRLPSGLIRPRSVSARGSGLHRRLRRRILWKEPSLPIIRLPALLQSALIIAKARNEGGRLTIAAPVYAERLEQSDPPGRRVRKGSGAARTDRRYWSNRRFSNRNCCG